MPADYTELARHGLDAKGKIVITRYGGGWRGLKAKLAQEHGAVGCIIYSDPHEDGYWSGDVYPKGGYRPDDGVQRGSVNDITLYSGDPLTPGVGSTEDAKRLPIEEAKTLMKIPVIPISYGDAKPLLEALDGQVAPASWRGALPITYHIGPGPAKVHLAIAFVRLDPKPIYDVIAVLQGSTYPNQWVVRGDHHDGWVFGAWDPLAGNVADRHVLEAGRRSRSSPQSGWKPLRRASPTAAGTARSRGSPALDRVGRDPRPVASAARPTNPLCEFRHRTSSGASSMGEATPSSTW